METLRSEISSELASEWQPLVMLEVSVLEAEVCSRAWLAGVHCKTLGHWGLVFVSVCFSRIKTSAGCPGSLSTEQT